MKRILAIIITMAIVAFAGKALACDHNNPNDPTCANGGVNKIWTDIWDPSPNIFFGTKDSVTVTSASYTFNITDEENGLFEPGNDLVNRYSINIDFSDDCDGQTEQAKINVDNVNYFTDSTATWSWFTWSWTYVINDKTINFDGLTQLNTDGTLTMIITKQSGDFYFNKAILTAFGCDYPPPPNNPPTSAPEPTTILLLGLGLVSLAGISRKMKK